MWYIVKRICIKKWKCENVLMLIGIKKYEKVNIYIYIWTVATTSVFCYGVWQTRPMGLFGKELYRT